MSFLTAFNWTMQFEDPKLEYADVPDAPGEWKVNPDNSKTWYGARAISGINSHAFPDQFAKIAALDQSSRGPAVQYFYHTNFWPSWLDSLTDDLAKRVFDSGVNAGLGTSARLLQEAVNSLGQVTLSTDGKIGPLSLQAIQGSDQPSLINAFQQARLKYYEDIVAKNPADQIYLEVWKTRALS